jgi:eukaryotic-like serine/threonine-protein kinase
VTDSSLETSTIEEELPAEIGEVLGNYRLESVLGQGGMGSVYRARHTLLGRVAAVKVLSASLAHDEQYVSRFFHEARVVNEIRHPNIVDIIDFIRLEAPRRVAYVMEYLEGPSLGRLLGERRLTPLQATNLCLQLVRALSAVHRRGVIHRDLKPDNLIIIGQIGGDFSESPSLKILDFGIAKSSDSASSSQHRTATGAILGTPAYMPPEQIAGERVSTAADIYPVGAIYAEMLTGARVFSGPALAVMRQKIVGEVPEILIDERVPEGAKIQPLIARCLDADAKRRPSIAELEAALLEILRAQPGAPVPSLPGVRTGEIAPPVSPEAFAPTYTPSPQNAPPPPRSEPAMLDTLGGSKSLPGLTSLRQDRNKPPLLVAGAALALLVIGVATWVAVRGEDEVAELPAAELAAPVIEAPAPPPPVIEPPVVPPPAPPVVAAPEPAPIQKKTTAPKRTKERAPASSPAPSGSRGPLKKRDLPSWE